MILADTSVLIDFLRGINNRSTHTLDTLLAMNVPVGINVYIYQEVLQGAKTEKDYLLLKRYLDSQQFYTFKKGRDSYAEAAQIYFKCRKKGITITSTIDCLIAQNAIENRLLLLHNDKDYEKIATVTPLKFFTL